MTHLAPEVRPEPPHRSHASIDMEVIFREMIRGELRAGRLTRDRRHRIVQYAAQLGFSAREAGDFMEECRAEALESGDPEQVRFALRLAAPPPASRRWVWQVSAGLAVLIVAQLIVRALRPFM